MPQMDHKSYAEAFDLVDDPEVDEETKSFLQNQMNEFEGRKPYLAARTLAEKTGDVSVLEAANQKMRTAGGPQMQTSMDAMKTAGINKPRSKEEYKRLQGVRLAGNVEDRGVFTGGKPEGPLGMDQADASFEYSAPEETRQEISEGLSQYRLEHPDEFPKPPSTTPDEDAGFQAYLRNEDRDQQAEDDGMGLTGYGHPEDRSRLPSASNRWELYAPPEHIPKGSDLAQLATAHYHLEPPIAMVRKLIVNRGRMTPEEAEGVTEDSDEYKRFSDLLWQETYDKAVAAGKPAIRVAYMNDDDWAGKIAKGSAVAMSKIAPVAYGADLSLSGGAVSEALSTGLGKALGDDNIREQVHGMRERDPLLTGAGAVVGALAPGGLAARVYSGVAGKLAPAGVGLGQRVLGAAGGAAATGATESIVGDVSQNAGEYAASLTPEDKSRPWSPNSERYYYGPGDVLQRALTAGAVAAPFGAAGELVASGAGGLVKMAREGRRGPALAQLEDAGMTTHPIRGATISPELQKIQERAAQGAKRVRTAEGLEDAPSHGRYPEDVLVGDLADPIAAEALRRQSETRARLGAEKLEYFADEGRLKVSTLPLKNVMREEFGELLNAPGYRREGQMIRDLTLDVPVHMDAKQLDLMVTKLDDLVNKAGDHNPGPFKRIRKAAMEMRDEFPKVDEPRMRKGDIEAEGNLSAMMMRHDVELDATRARNQGAGLPAEMSARPEAGGTKGPPLPRLSHDENQAFRNRIAGTRGGTNRELSDAELTELASGAGFEKELAQLVSLNARKEIKEAGKLRSVFGSQGTMSMYSGNPAEVLHLRTDPLMRVLSKQEPSADMRISPELWTFVKSLVSGKSRTTGPMTVLDDLRRGIRGRGSARQLGTIGGSVGAARGRRFERRSDEEGSLSYSDLDGVEQDMLRHLIYLATQKRRQAASGE